MSVNFHLTARQKANLAKNKPVQLSHQQLTGQKADAIHQMSLPMTKKGFTKMEKAIKQGKGFRINPAEHLGGDIFSSIGKSLKKGANDVGDTLSKTTKTASKGLAEFANLVDENDVGGKIEQIKSAVPKSTLKSIMKIGLVASGVDEQEADIIAGSTTGAIYENDFNKPLQADKLASGALKGAVASSSSSSSSGKGFKGSGFKGSALPLASPMSFKGSGFKGSGFQGSGITENLNKMTGGKGTPEMKQKMAELRAMRGKKGGSFKDS